MSKSREGKVELKGQLIPTDYDEEGNVVSFVFSSDDDRTYLVQPGVRSPELEECVNEYLKVKGVVRKNNGEFFLNIRKIEQVENDLWNE